MKRRTAVATRAAAPARAVSRNEAAIAPRLPGQPLDIARAISEELEARRLDAKERIKRKLKGLHPMD